MTPQTDRGEETRRRILAEAAEAFADRGYASTSLSDLVSATGLTKGAFYFHFASKEELALEVFRSKHEEWHGKVLSVLEREERAIDRMVAVMRTVTELIEADPSARCVGRLADELSREPQLASIVNGQFEAWVELSTELLLRAQEEGDVRADLDPAEVSEVAVAGFIGLEHVSGTRGVGDLPRWVERFTNILLDAIGTKQREKA